MAKRLFGIFFFVFVLLLFLLMPNRYNGVAYWEQYDLSQWIIILGYILMILSFALGLVLIFHKFYKRGDVIISNDEILFNGVTYKVSNFRDFEVTLNTVKYKPKSNRTILTGGGNNWLKFRYDDKFYVIEFLVKNKADEEMLKSILSEWSELISFNIGKSREQFLIRLLDY